MQNYNVFSWGKKPNLNGVPLGTGVYASAIQNQGMATLRAPTALGMGLCH